MGELLAVGLLVDRGYRVVAQNVSGRLGEIDIVARVGKELVVVEVKTITDPRGTPLARIDAEKAARL